MDLWAAAAAVATGYVAKHCRKLSRSKNILPELDSDIINNGKPESPSSHFSRFRERRELGKVVLVDMENGLDQRYSAKNQVVSNSVKSLMENESSITITDECTLSGDILCSSNISVEELDSLQGSLQEKSYFRTRYFNGHCAKPLSLIDSSLRAQLRKGNSKVEEYVLSPPPSPSTAITRPLLVSNVRQMSRAHDDFASTQIRTDRDWQYAEERIIDVPQLPRVGYFSQSRKSKLRIVKGRNVRCSSSSKLCSKTHIQAEEGSQGGTVLFCLGISIGIISSFIANRREVGKLKELLKQTENLVQDLHEELDMRESLTVKELVNDKTQDNSTSGDLTKCNNGKIEESSESMSKIEAELEVELERLGLNMNASISQRELTALDELDPDFAAEFAEGELRVDLANGSTISHSKSKQERSSTSTPNFENYIVSPRELSLRLHEVVQSRLEERIQELETALQRSQMTMKSVESECTTCQRKSRLDELSETPKISKAIEIEPHKEAIVIADEEPMKVNESEEEDSQYGTYRTSDETCKEEHSYSTVKTSPNCWSRVEEELFGIGGDDENTSDSDDEMDQQLIKQIVEKTKKGSPAVMNAQRVLFWTDE